MRDRGGPTIAVSVFTISNFAATSQNLNYTYFPISRINRANQISKYLIQIPSVLVRIPTVSIRIPLLQTILLVPNV